MKVLLLSCSPSGEIDEVTRLLAKSLCAHNVQLLYEKNIPAPIRFLRRNDSFLDPGVTLGDFDLIVLGIERLDGSYVKSLRVFFEKQGISQKKIAYYYLDELKARFAHRELQKTLSGNRIMGSLAIKDVSTNYHKYVIPIVQWANNIVSRSI